MNNNYSVIFLFFRLILYSLMINRQTLSNLFIQKHNEKRQYSNGIGMLIKHIQFIH